MSSIYCPSCGYKSDRSPNVYFCSSCGYSLNPKMKARQVVDDPEEDSEVPDKASLEGSISIDDKHRNFGFRVPILDSVRGYDPNSAMSGRQVQKQTKKARKQEVNKMIEFIKPGRPEIIDDGE